MVRQARSSVSGFGYTLFNDTDRNKAVEMTIPLNEDGHCTFRPGDENLFVTDTYPKKGVGQKLLLGDLRTRRLVELGTFYCPEAFMEKGYRCDLHPRWDLAGNRICIDTLMDGTRQIVVYDVSEVVKRIRHQ